MNALGRLVLGMSISVVALGCGGAASDQPDVGLVKGTITMDGQPLTKATVVFTPEKGRASSGPTDASGHYELSYIRNTKGAVFGKHRVSITTRMDAADPSTEVNPDQGNPDDPIPATYNSKTTLSANVLQAENTFDFELKSE